MVMAFFIIIIISQQNQDSKHRTYVYVLTVTETLEDWEDSVNIGRLRHNLKQKLYCILYAISAMIFFKLLYLSMC